MYMFGNLLPCPQIYYLSGYWETRRLNAQIDMDLQTIANDGARLAAEEPASSSARVSCGTRLHLILRLYMCLFV